MNVGWEVFDTHTGTYRNYRHPARLTQASLFISIGIISGSPFANREPQKRKTSFVIGTACWCNNLGICMWVLQCITTKKKALQPIPLRRSRMRRSPKSWFTGTSWGLRWARVGRSEEGVDIADTHGIYRLPACLRQAPLSMTFLFRTCIFQKQLALASWILAGLLSHVLQRDAAIIRPAGSSDNLQKPSHSVNKPGKTERKRLLAAFHSYQCSRFCICSLL